jgi:PAS domain S-box-containing protein
VANTINLKLQEVVRVEDKYRRSGIDTMGDIPWGTHMCQIFRIKGDLLDILVPYFRAGLENNEFCMWVTSEPLGVKEAEASLRKVVKNLDGYIEKDQIEILDYSEWYTKSGKFNTDEVLQGWVEKEGDALEKGFNGLRATGNTSWLGADDWVAFREYEAIVDSVIGEHRMIAICTYSLDRCEASEILDVMNNHEVTLVKRNGLWRTVESDERKRLKKMLTASEVRFRRLFETAQDGILILDADTGQITDSNPFIEGLLGYTAEELLGKKIWEIGLLKDLAKSGDAFKKLQSEGYIRYEDLKLETKDGKSVDVEFISNVYDVDHEKIIQCNIREISKRKEAEEVSEQYKELLEELVKQRTSELAESNRKLLQELTERKQAEEQLQNTRDYLDSLIQYANAPIIVWDTETRITLFNTAFQRMTGYEAEEVIGQLLSILFPEASRDESLVKIRQASAGEYLELVEIPILHKDGGLRMVLWNSANIYDKEHRTLLATIAQGMDITEQKRMEYALSERFKELSCLHSIDMIGSRPELNAQEICQEVLSILPQAWQYPEITCARITANDKKFESEDYRDTEWKQSSDIMIRGSKVGEVEVCYLEERPELDEGPFLKEEMLIIDSVAEQLARILDAKQAEEALKDSEERFRTIIDSASDGILLADLEAKRFYIGNKAICKMLGYSMEELKNMGITDIHPEESLPYVLEQFEKQLRGETTLAADIPIERKDGSVFYADINSSNVAFGGESYLAGIFRDTTEQKRAEEKLLDSEARYRRLFEAAQDAILILDGDTGQIIDANPFIKNLLGYSQEELLGKNLWEIGEFKDVLASKLSYEQLHKEGYVRYDHLPLVAKDGRIIAVEVVANAYQVESRRIIQCNIRDVTGRKKAEDALREAEEKWRSLVNNAPNIIMLVDRDRKIQFINRAVSGIATEDIIGKSIYDYIQPEYHKTVREVIDNVFHTGEIGTYEIMGTGPDGSTAWYETSTGPLKHEKQIIGVIQVSSDITERKKMQAQLLTNDRLASIGELISGIAHELNNPLTGVIGFSDMLVGREDLPNDIKEDIKTINREAQRTANIVKNLLTFARKQPKERQLTDINRVIEAVIELRAYEQKVNNIEVNTRFASDLPEITANSFDLQQVFLNIMVNAEHAMLEAHGKGTITITTVREGDIIRVSLADDGPGISEEHIGHVFDPFFTTKEVGKGTGLGLSICYGTVTDHGGRIYVESKPGKGATFIIELPVETTDNEGTKNENS